MVSDKTAAYMRTLKLTLALLHKRVLSVGGCLSCDALASGRHDRVGDAGRRAGRRCRGACCAGSSRLAKISSRSTSN